MMSNYWPMAAEHTSTGNGGLDQAVELLVTTDGKLKVTRSDTFHLEIFTCITSQLKHLQSASRTTEYLGRVFAQPLDSRCPATDLYNII